MLHDREFMNVCAVTFINPRNPFFACVTFFFPFWRSARICAFNDFFHPMLMTNSNNLFSFLNNFQTNCARKSNYLSSWPVWALSCSYFWPQVCSFKFQVAIWASSWPIRASSWPIKAYNWPPVGPFDFHVGPFEPQVGPFEPQYGQLSLKVGPSEHHHIGRFSPFLGSKQKFWPRTEDTWI